MSPRRVVSVLLLASSSLLFGACSAHHGAAATLQPASVPLTWLEPVKALDHVDVFQNPAIKIGLITLQGGATMPEHAAPLPVLLTATSGRGAVTMNGTSLPLDPAHAVFLPGGEKHAVVAEAGEPLRIAVVAVKGPKAASATQCEH